MNFDKLIPMDEIKEKKLENIVNAYTKGIIDIDSTTKYSQYNADVQNSMKKEDKQKLLNEFLTSLKQFYSDTQKETNDLIKIVDEIKFPLKNDVSKPYLSEYTTSAKIEYSNALMILNSPALKIAEVLKQIKNEKRNDLFFYVCDLIKSTGNLDRSTISDVNEVESEYMKSLNIEVKINQIGANKIIMDVINIYLGYIGSNSFNKEKADEKITSYKFNLFA